MVIGRGSKFFSPVVAGLMVTLLSACVTVAPGAPTAPNQGPSSSAAPTPAAATTLAPEPNGTAPPTAEPEPSVEVAPTVSPVVNLVITNFQFEPDTIKAGEPTVMRLSVKNIGSATSPPFIVGFGFTTESGGGGGFKALNDPDGLLPGGQTNYSIPPGLFDADVYLVTAEVDSDDQIDEDSEDDNQATATLTVTPAPAGPNLVITSFTITPASICAGDSAVFAYSISNTGTEAATEFFAQIGWTSTDGGSGSYNGPYFEVLNPGAPPYATSDSHEIDASGEYTFTAVVDPDNNVAEPIESDNETQANLSVC